MASASLVTVADYARAAQRRLPRMLSDFVAGGAMGETTLRRNSDGFGTWWLRQRAFRSSPDVQAGREVFGTRLRIPVIIAPTGASGLLWPAGEAEVARAAAEFGTVMSVSAGSIQSMEEIAAAAPGPRWLQLFLYKDRGLTLEFLQRAKAAGYGAICVTTDCPVHGMRERDVRNGFTINPRLTLSTMLDAALHAGWWLRMMGRPPMSMRNFEGRATGGISDMAAYIASVLDPAVTWDDLSWLRSQWDGPLIVKGLVHPDDAREAVQRGADAIQVSNHGGRQLDTGLASIDALPAIVEALGGSVPVFLDGGVTRGTDVLKAVALGATAVLIGRAHLYGLAVAGRRGVRAILDILEQEMRNAMTIGGWRDLAALDRDAVMRLPNAE
ncbi:alpha-hydroxy acid oxidase [Humitalea sp. 24SJ18S-53]|uniref:alpha-hydroxy acid oxidase n=1 Tax=Humitalea sp. 24SJ18S-53 TaxID=3422307 RepID=UPI003D66E40C